MSNSASTEARSCPARMRSRSARSPSARFIESNDDGFTCAGLTGEHIHALGKFDGQVIDEGDIFNAELAKHRTPPLCCGAGGSAYFLARHLLNLLHQNFDVLGVLRDDEQGIVARNGADDFRPMERINGFAAACALRRWS